jgi:hypothetical protein
MVLVVVTGAAVLVFNHGGPTRTAAAGRVGPTPGNARSTAMVGSGGEQVGRIFVTSRDPALVMVSVDYPIPSGAYAVEQRSGGATRRLGEMHVSNGHGTWGGITTAGRHGSFELVDANGVVLCEASIPS